MGLFYIFLSIVLLGAACYAWDYRRRNRRDDAPAPKPAADGECCGQHAVCEKESLLAAAAAAEIVYYDDEELDRHKGKSSDEYTPDETAEFEEIFTTLAPGEIAGWVRSLQLRGVALPDTLKDEVLLVVSERRGLSERKP